MSSRSLSSTLLQSNPQSGINSDVYICMLGLLPAAWSLLGYDSTAHMIEETKDADATAGWPMPYAIGVAAISGLPYIVALTLCVQVAFHATLHKSAACHHMRASAGFVNGFLSLATNCLTRVDTHAEAACDLI